jgi:hypothetical protein
MYSIYSISSAKSVNDAGPILDFNYDKNAPCMQALYIEEISLAPLVVPIFGQGN